MHQLLGMFTSFQAHRGWAKCMTVKDIRHHVSQERHSTLRTAAGSLKYLLAIDESDNPASADKKRYCIFKLKV